MSFRGLSILCLVLALALMIHSEIQAQNGARPAQQSPPQKVAKGNGKTGKQDKDLPKGLNVKAALTNQDPLDSIRQGCRSKIYELKMKANTRYIIDMEGNFDTYIRVENSKKQNLAEDDDGGNGLNSRLTFIPTQDDTYRIIATSCAGGQIGNYTLRVNPIVMGPALIQKNGELTATDPYDVLMQGSYHKVVNLKLEKGKTYTLELNSQTFFPYLRIEDFRGNQVSTSNGRFERNRTEIIFQPEETESYRIIVTSRGSNQTGAFNLSVR